MLFGQGESEASLGGYHGPATLAGIQGSAACTDYRRVQLRYRKTCPCSTEDAVGTIYSIQGRS
jgi:hypothetical protein